MPKILEVFIFLYVAVAVAFRATGFRRKDYLTTTALARRLEMHSGNGAEYSFVQDELRPVAMKLHTKDQAPREGQQKEKTPFTKWEPSRQDYTQFLVDSLMVYNTFEQIVSGAAACLSDFFS